MKTIQTKRLILRPWKQEDLEPLSRLNADPRVMEFMFKPLTREKSAARLECYTNHDDFDHPLLPEGHPLKRHLLYRLKKSEWVKNQDKNL